MTTSLAALGAEGFQPPEPNDFVFAPYFDSLPWFTRPTLQLLLSVGVIAGLFYLTAKPRAMVPGKLQFAGESAYAFVRNGIARDIIGARDFKRFVPWLFALFYFLILNNLYGIIPYIQFPTMSVVAFPYVLTAISYIVFNVVGIARHGFLRYVKIMTVPSGVPFWLLPIIVPIEFMSNFLVRPITLSLRLFANMFAGHLLILVFALGAEYLLIESAGLLKVAGVASLALALVFTFFEALVQVLQAYIFTLLSALYVAGSLTEEH